MRQTLKACTIALTTSFLLSVSFLATAQERQQVTIIVPSPPGSANDVLARLIAQKLPSTWGAAIIENKTGASGAIAANYVAKSPEKSNTVLLTHTVHVQAPYLIDRLSYDPITDFVGISEIAKSPVVLVVTPDFAAKNIDEFIRLIKKEPNSYSYGSYGVGTTGHILAELLLKETNTTMTHVPYRGGSPLAMDMLGGQVQIGMLPTSVAVTHIKNGKLIPLAITGSQRSQQLPDVPTFLESGFDKFNPDTWLALLGPSHMSQEMVNEWKANISTIYQDPEIIEKIQSLTLEQPNLDNPDFSQTLKKDYQQWGSFIQDIGADRFK